MSGSDWPTKDELKAAKKEIVLLYHSDKKCPQDSKEEEYKKYGDPPTDEKKCNDMCNELLSIHRAIVKRCTASVRKR